MNKEYYECSGCGERYDSRRWLSDVEYKGEVLPVCRCSFNCAEAAKAEIDDRDKMEWNDQGLPVAKQE